MFYDTLSSSMKYIELIWLVSSPKDCTQRNNIFINNLTLLYLSRDICKLGNFSLQHTFSVYCRKSLQRVNNSNNNSLITRPEFIFTTEEITWHAVNSLCVYGYCHNMDTGTWWWSMHNHHTHTVATSLDRPVA